MSRFRFFSLIASSTSVSLTCLGIFMSSTFPIATLMSCATLQILPVYAAIISVVIVNSSECVDVPTSYTTPSNRVVAPTNRFIANDDFFVYAPSFWLLLHPLNPVSVLMVTKGTFSWIFSFILQFVVVTV